MPKIDFEDNTIGNILRGKRLRVPINQRSYAWEKEHVQELLSDFNGAISGRAGEYFLGSIIVVQSGELAEVHDGQQRLATSMILIAAIRDYFVRSGDEETAKEISKDSLFSRDRKTLEYQPHLSLSAEDNMFFVDAILRNPGDERRKEAKADPKKQSHLRLAEAADFASAFIKSIADKLPSKQIGLELHRWLDFIEQSAKVIWVQVADEATAFQVFETMNDRGLKLSSADLIKNYLFSLGGLKKDEIVQHWQSMTGILESLGSRDGDVVDFIRCVWVVEHGPTRSSAIFQGIKSEVSSRPAAVAWSNKLVDRSQNYVAMLTSSSSEWTGFHQQTRSAIDTLRFFGVSQIRPLLLAASLKFSNKEQEKVFQIAISWSVRCFIVGVPSGTLEGHYARTAKKVYDGELKNVDQLSREMKVIIPDDVRFRAAMSTAIVSESQIARYYLRVLQMQADGQSESEYVPNDSKAITLEHVLPIKSNAGWEHFDVDAAKVSANRLGNQALLPGRVNSRLGNSSFAEKKKALKESGFSLTSEIAEVPHWTVEEISKRQNRLADLAVKAWPA